MKYGNIDVRDVSHQPGQQTVTTNMRLVIEILEIVELKIQFAIVDLKYELYSSQYRGRLTFEFRLGVYEEAIKDYFEDFLYCFLLHQTEILLFLSRYRLY